jgi:hypothetical protein
MSRLQDQQFNQFIDEPKLVKAIVIAAVFTGSIIGVATAVVTYYSFW